MRAILLIVAAAAFSGCYTYTPVQTAPAVGTMVRVRVPVTSAVAGRTAPQETADLEGLLVGTGDTLFLATETRRELGAYREITQFDTIRVATNQTASVEIREFSSARSIALGGIIAAAATVAAVVAFNGLSGSEGEESPGPGSPDTALVVRGSLLSTLWGLLSR